MEAMKRPTAWPRSQPEYEARIIKMAGIVDAAKKFSSFVIELESQVMFRKKRKREKYTMMIF